MEEQPENNQAKERLDEMKERNSRLQGQNGEALGKQNRIQGSLKQHAENRMLAQVPGRAMEAKRKLERVRRTMQTIGHTIKNTVTAVVKTVFNPYFWIAVLVIIGVIYVVSTLTSMTYTLGQNENACGAGGGSSNVNVGTGSGDYQPGEPGKDYYEIDKAIFEKVRNQHNDFYAQRMKEFAPHAQKAVARVKQEAGVALPASVLLAQTIKESSAGKATPPGNPYNIGGLGCTDALMAAGKQCKFVPKSYEDYFYQVAQNFVKTSAYKPCLGAQNWYEFLKCILPKYASVANPKNTIAGVTPSAEYVSQVSAWIAHYGLDAYDAGYNVKPIDIDGYVATNAKASDDFRCNQGNTMAGRPMNAGTIAQLEAQGYALLVTKEGFVSYQQMEGKVKNLHLGPCGSVGDCGCGPTSFLSAATALTGKFIPPEEVYKKAGEKGVIVGAGSLYTLPGALAPEFGLRAEPVALSVAAINDVLNKKGMVWLCGSGAAPFSRGGHCVVIRGRTANGNWLFFDSSDRDPDAEYNPSDIVARGGKQSALYAQ